MTSQDIQRFGQIVQVERRMLKISQSKLGELVGLSRSTIVRLEMGTVEKVSQDSLRRICTHLKIDPVQALIMFKFLKPEDAVQGARLPPDVVEVVGILMGGYVSEADKELWIEFLRYKRDKAVAERKAGE